MSGRTSHILQAQHNEALAIELIDGGYRYKDWAVIATFYAAVHFVEARLHDFPPFTHPHALQPILHSENSIPQGGRFGRYSPHQWRENLIMVNCDAETFNNYRQLRRASESARYHSRITAQTTSHDHFSNRAVEWYVFTQLSQLKTALGFS